MTDTEVVEAVNEGFKNAPRPDYFAFHKTDCDECIAADLTFDSRTTDTITLENLSLELTSPLSLINPEGFRYYFRALVRLCIEQPDQGLTYQIITHLIPLAEKTQTSLARKKEKKKKSETLSNRQEYFSLLTQAEK